MARIVCVDDEPCLREALKLCLERDGHEVWATDSGHEALRLIRTGVVDLLVQDIMRPGMNGLAVLRELRTDPRTANFPVIVVSQGEVPPVPGFLDPKTGGMVLADDWLSKPWTAAALSASVSRLLQERSTTRPL